MKREQILSAILEVDKDPSKLLELVKKHNTKSDPFDLGEFLQALSKRQFSQLWSGVKTVTEEWAERAIERLQEGAGENSDEIETEDERQLDDETVLLFSGIVTLCQSSLAVESPTTPPDLRDTLLMLHEILVLLLDCAPELQNRVSVLCEGWWCGGREGREELMPNTLLYVVARTLTEGATQADVKRVWLVREAFLLLDFEDSATEPFKTMLLSCTLQHAYLNSEEGRKFLSYLFGMHPKFVEDLHQTIKNQIPHSPKSLLETYGEIYYRAWRLASGPYLKQIEEYCLQDLMYSAINAPRHGLHSLFHSLRKLLSYIHQQRSQKSVSEMLSRLYNPFLWRSLKVANVYVRANAATLFLDAFPLQDPDSSREEMDAVMQKQFDAMTELLEDPSVMVRVVAVAGVCRVLSYYWEMTPAPVIKTLLGRLVKDLAWDTSAINVRVAVLQGLCVVLENRLSHPLMRELLPLLQNHLHDTSEKVRIAFIELLLLVKGMRMVKFWHIAPLEHLLARMEVDTVHVVKRIVALLVDSFQPENVSPRQQIERCVALLRANQGASRRFYQLAVAHLSVGDVIKFILSIHTAIVQCVKSEGVEREGVKSEGRGRRGRGGGGKEEQEEEEEDMESSENDKSVSDDSGEDERTGIAEGGWRKEKAGSKTQLNEDMEKESDSSSCLSLEDGDLLTGLLETIVVLWEGARERMEKPGNKQLKKKLTSTMAASMPLLFDTFKDGPSRSALYLLASYLPKRSVSSISKGSLVALSSLRYPTKSQDYTSLLVALVAWQQAADVVKLTNQWLAPQLNWSVHIEGEETYCDGLDENCTRNATRPKKKGKRGKPILVPGPINGLHPDHTHQALLALDILNWMTGHPSCLQELKGLSEFWELSSLLKRSMDLLEQTVFAAAAGGAPPPPHPPVSFELLSRSLSLYVRLCMHKRAESQGGSIGKGSAKRKGGQVKKKASASEDRGDDSDGDGGDGGERGSEEFVSEIVGVVDWCTRVVLPALSEGFMKGPPNGKLRQSSRKRKAGQTHPPPQPPPPPTTNQAREIIGAVLNLLSEMLMTGLSEDGPLELEFAKLGAAVADSPSGISLLPSLCKLLYQLCEASSKSELDGIHAGVGSLQPTALLLTKILEITRSMSETNPDGFTKVWCQVRQCVSAIVVTSIRTHSLSHSSHLLDTYTSIVKALLHRRVEHIKQYPSLEPPSNFDDLSLFSGCLMKQACKDMQSRRLFAIHLGASLEDCDPGDLPSVLLTHQASLHLIAVLASSLGCHGDDEVMRCVRQSIRLVGETSEQQKLKWNGPLSELSGLVDVVQERLLYR